MNERCREIREKLEDIVARQPITPDREAIDRHLAECDKCAKYREALESDDRMFRAFAASLEGLGSRIEDGVMKTRTERRERRAPRFLERSAVRFAAAAIVIVAIVLTSNVLDRSKSRDVVWAEVAKRIENPPSYIARSQTIKNGRVGGGFVRYNSPDLGRRVDMYRDGAPVHWTVYNIANNSRTTVDFKARTFLRDTLGADSYYDPAKDAHLRRMLEFMERDHIELGISEIEGRRVSGIEWVDTLHFPWPEGKVRVKRIYVDIETQLPVLFENGKGTDDYRRVEYDWHPQFKPEDFDPEIPDGFFVADVRAPMEDLVGRAKTGLRNFAEITGRYPEELSFYKLREDLASVAEELQNTGTFSPEIEDSLNTILHAAALLRWSDHEPRDFEPRIFDVYDKSVKPGDSESILYRWRIHDKVGVLYGDLRFETTGTEPFAEIDAKRWEEYMKRNEEAAKKMEEERRRIGSKSPSQ